VELEHLIFISGNCGERRRASPKVWFTRI